MLAITAQVLNLTFLPSPPQCVGECGSDGVRHRNVECVGVVNGVLVTFDPSMCDNATKPKAEESCILSNCCRWVTGSFGPVSKQTSFSCLHVGMYELEADISSSVFYHVWG